MAATNDVQASSSSFRNARLRKGKRSECVCVSYEWIYCDRPLTSCPCCPGRLQSPGGKKKKKKKRNDEDDSSNSTKIRAREGGKKCAHSLSLFLIYTIVRLFMLFELGQVCQCRHARSVHSLGVVIEQLSIDDCLDGRGVLDLREMGQRSKQSKRKRRGK